MTASEQEERARLLRAWNGARRSLAPSPVGGSIGARLARLSAEGAEAYDLSDWPDVYGNPDGIVGELERRTAAALGTESAAYFPTGTMAQQAALRCWAGRTGNDTVAMHPLAHPVRWERDALRQLTGLRVTTPTDAPRLPTAAEVRELADPFGTLALELPLREAGFLLPSWEELESTVAAARERDAVVHIDGARLWECTTHFGRTLPEIASLADTVYVSFYKSLGGLSGAALAGPETVIEEAAAWRHRYGGQIFQQWPAALSALVGLERELPRLPAYVAHARVVAEALHGALADAGTATEAGTGAEAGMGAVPEAATHAHRKGADTGAGRSGANAVSWWRVWPRVPHTHQFQVWLPYGAGELTEAGARQAEETGTLLFRRWTEPPGAPPGLAMTEVTVAATGLSWSDEDVREALAGFLGCLRMVTTG
ncbi:threonine aldolase family protein [Streptomyces marispadix]|uniref:Beta-eliminating lyase-related protein n=1 Tax=Streptomyces marispadix TaxID=2922868 RepID=A0ABS9SZX4_9ACTN|nr:beta-eliminating lyase-related protein [Streptomyces marispadix]MCH6161836.1 beta-eliminating lyase-related protein [Streptomyces marispadix]